MRNRTWDKFCDWLRDCPLMRPGRPIGGLPVLLGIEEDLVGNALRVKLGFTGLPRGYETEIVERCIITTVTHDGATEVNEHHLPATEPTFAFGVEQGSEVTIEVKYIDDAGNKSLEPAVLGPFLVEDTVPPPNVQADAVTVEIEEIVEDDDEDA